MHSDVGYINYTVKGKLHHLIWNGEVRFNLFEFWVVGHLVRAYHFLTLVRTCHRARHQGVVGQAAFAAGHSLGSLGLVFTTGGVLPRTIRDRWAQAFVEGSFLRVPIIADSGAVLFPDVATEAVGAGGHVG